MPQTTSKEFTSEQIHMAFSNFQFSSNVTTQSKMSSINQQVMCIWFHDEYLLKNIQDKMENHLKQTFSHVKAFTDKDKLILYLKYLQCVQLDTFFFIFTGEYAESLCGLVKESLKSDKIHVYELVLEFDYSSTNSEFWVVCHGVDELFKHIYMDMKKMDPSETQSECQIEDERITIDDLFPTFGLFNSSLEEKSFHLLSSDSLRFLLFRLCFQVVTGMNHDASTLNEMCSYFRNQYKPNTPQLQKIDQFRISFDANHVIYRYTDNSFVYQLINQAFRSEDIERIFKCRHYITHLHQQLTKQINEQGSTFSGTHVYRGQKLPIAALLKLQENVDRLISMNGFLSTSKYCDVAAQFACAETNVDGYDSVIFVMEIDRTKLMKMVCADISTQSKFKEEGEFLFSIGTVWKLESVEKGTYYWTIKLSFCNDIDSQLAELDERLTNGFTFLSLGNILRELGDKSNAENFYYRMFDVSNLSKETLGHVFYNLGTLAAEQGRYADALRNIQKAEELIPLRKGCNDRQETTNLLVYSHNKLPSRLRVWNTLGLLYQKKGSYEDAHKSFMQALNEEGDELEKAVVNNNLGLLEFDYGKYQQSLEYHTKAIQMTKRDVWLTEFKKNWNRVKEHISQMQ